MADHHIASCLENGATIKTAKRDQRQKNDKLDAREIAMYAIRYPDELKLFKNDVINTNSDFSWHLRCVAITSPA